MFRLTIAACILAIATAQFGKLPEKTRCSTLCPKVSGSRSTKDKLLCRILT